MKVMIIIQLISCYVNTLSWMLDGRDVEKLSDVPKYKLVVNKNCDIQKYHNLGLGSRFRL